mmetsp:Transcript_31261/g.96121  ORF Transcript_31261/g.96121 Transcript_31261/m.96121 type:complete len:312 (-) Transcript_31261:937-1872(-)
MMWHRSQTPKTAIRKSERQAMSTARPCNARSIQCKVWRSPKPSSVSVVPERPNSRSPKMANAAASGTLDGTNARFRPSLAFCTCWNSSSDWCSLAACCTARDLEALASSSASINCSVLCFSSCTAALTTSSAALRWSNSLCICLSSSLIFAEPCTSSVLLARKRSTSTVSCLIRSSAAAAVACWGWPASASAFFNSCTSCSKPSCRACVATSSRGSRGRSSLPASSLSFSTSCSNSRFRRSASASEVSRCCASSASRTRKCSTSLASSSILRSAAAADRACSTSAARSCSSSCRSAWAFASVAGSACRACC